METDFYRAGAMAAILDGEKNGRVIVFFEQRILAIGRSSFLQGFTDQEKSTEPIFLTSFSQFSTLDNISCVVLAGTGVEFMENNKDIPIIFFSWLNPAYSSRSTVIIFDDSPFAQAVKAVKIAAAGKNEAEIPSKTMVFSARIADKGILRLLRKTTVLKRL
jgi:hypothetical protein